MCVPKCIVACLVDGLLGWEEYFILIFYSRSVMLHVATFSSSVVLEYIRIKCSILSKQLCSCQHDSVEELEKYIRSQLAILLPCNTSKCISNYHIICEITKAACLAPNTITSSISDLLAVLLCSVVILYYCEIVHTM